MKSSSLIGLVVGAFLTASLAVFPIPTRASAGFSGLQGGFSLVGSEEAHGMKDFPVLESVTPIPSSLKPLEQSEISLFCEAEVRMAGKAVTKTKGTFDVDLYLLNTKTGKFETFNLGQGKVKLNSIGQGSFYLNASMAPFRDRFRSNDVLGWFRTHGRFGTKKGDFAALFCTMFSE